MNISIVINTLNRGPMLNRTLESLRWLKYAGEFEVIVVDGPSSDNTQEVISTWSTKIRTGKCDVANLSVSRNVGICMAQGEIVAFIDDDAIPEPEWLAQLAAAYDSPEIGGAGGLVFDQTGYQYQYQYSTATRLANANWSATKSAEHFCFPGSFEFPYLQGTNASFRRSALLEVGGFDEEIEYYLDETELCCRLVDAGYVIRQLPCAYVHHKFAPSHIRDNQRITRHRYPVIKNKIYFSLKHGREYLGLSEIFDDDRRFSLAHEQDVRAHVTAGNLPSDELNQFWSENQRAWDDGVTRGMADSARLITDENLRQWQGAFARFPTLQPGEARCVILVSRDFPPHHSGGIATFNRDLAQALAARGHIVHVVTQSTDIDRVDFEEGVWVHRMVIRDLERPPEALERDVPQHIWNWSATALREAERIASHRPIDAVEAPIWDCEGIAFLLSRHWPLVTSLQTTMQFWLDSHPEHRSDTAWMRSFGIPMLSLEAELMSRSDCIRSISAAIRRDIEQAYKFTFEDARVFVAPLGMADFQPFATRAPSATITVLFVGRLEHRKGIDVLLNAIPSILEAEPDVRFRILGDNSLPGPDGCTYREAFLASENGMRWSSNVRFEGRVDEATLNAAYADCDIFVAPSRFESFGLVFLEAMREAKPVVGGLAGGVPEVVSQNVNGLLVAPGDAPALAAAVLRLVRSPELRETMGVAGRKIFLERFTSEQMAWASEDIYHIAAKNFHSMAQ